MLQVLRSALQVVRLASQVLRSFCAVVRSLLQMARLALQVPRVPSQVPRSALHVVRSPLQVTRSAGQSGSGPPASAAATSLVCCMMNACSDAPSPFDGHIPPPLVSANCHLDENFSSHLLKSGMLATLTAFDSAFARQKTYLPAACSLPDSHLSAASIATAPLADVISASAHTDTLTLILYLPRASGRGPLPYCSADSSPLHSVARRATLRCLRPSS